MTAAAAVEPTELEELMEAQAEAAHEREVGDATRPTAEDLAASPTASRIAVSRARLRSMVKISWAITTSAVCASAWAWCSSAPTRFP